jgi:molybdate/tungstate transport system substrate-binding protein
MLAVTVAVVVIVGAAGGVYYEYVVGAKPSKPLLIYSADSYVGESALLGSGFANSTGTPYAAPTSGGSFALAREIAAGSPVDVFVSVSKAALTSQYLQSRAPGWAIAFAADQMVIAYSGAPQGEAATVLSDFSRAGVSNSTADYNAAFSSLVSGDVKVGIANPSGDPAGLRGWLVLEMAGYLYGGGTNDYVNSIVSNHGNYTGVHASALIAPLQSGTIQFLFLYKSAAVSHGLNYISLPRQVNLGDPTLGSFYATFSYQLPTGPSSGSPILLFVTVPGNATQGANALSFVTYVVQHTSSLTTFGLTVYSPAQLYNSTAIPAQVAALLASGELVRVGTL